MLSTHGSQFPICWMALPCTLPDLSYQTLLDSQIGNVIWITAPSLLLTIVYQKKNKLFRASQQ